MTPRSGRLGLIFSASLFWHAEFVNIRLFSTTKGVDMLVHGICLYTMYRTHTYIELFVFVVWSISFRPFFPREHVIFDYTAGIRCSKREWSRAKEAVHTIEFKPRRADHLSEMIEADILLIEAVHVGGKHTATHAEAIALGAELFGVANCIELGVLFWF